MSELTERFVAWGARQAAELRVEEVPFARSFRTLCQSNACGKYGTSYMCPPDIGEIDALIARAKTFERVVLYQTVGLLEDSYDIEGMLAAGQRHNDLAQKISQELSHAPFSAVLHLGAGGCRVCSVCAKVTGEPCRFPQRAISSLEAYGVDVSALTARCGMNYINGQNTVTYFGAYFYCE